MKEQQKETSAKMVTLNKFAPKDSQTKTDGMYDPALNMTTAVSVRLSISKVSRHMRPWRML